jgi:prephenate dehydratase
MFALDVLAEGVNDREDNTTTFLVLRKAQDGEDEFPIFAGIDRGVEGERWKMLVTVSGDHLALEKCRRVFEKYSIQLTSRSSGIEDWNYFFFVEPRNRLGDVDRALKEAREVCAGFRWMGSWEDRVGGGLINVDEASMSDGME